MMTEEAAVALVADVGTELLTLLSPSPILHAPLSNKSALFSH